MDRDDQSTDPGIAHAGTRKPHTNTAPGHRLDGESLAVCYLQLTVWKHKIPEEYRDGYDR